MTYQEARKKLEAVGYQLIRNGNGSHMIYQRGDTRLVLSAGNSELSHKQTSKVRMLVRRAR